MQLLVLGRRIVLMNLAKKINSMLIILLQRLGLEIRGIRERNILNPPPEDLVLLCQLYLSIVMLASLHSEYRATSI